jgi:hypothetical protein
LWFGKTGNKWFGRGVDINDEYEAKKFALGAGYNRNYIEDGITRTTQFGFIGSLNPSEAIWCTPILGKEIWRFISVNCLP